MIEVELISSVVKTESGSFYPRVKFKSKGCTIKDGMVTVEKGTSGGGILISFPYPFDSYKKAIRKAREGTEMMREAINKGLSEAPKSEVESFVCR